MNIQKEDIQRVFEKNYDAVIVQFEIPVEIIIETCRIAKQRGIPVIVDAGPAQNFPLEQIKGIDILSPNETEVFAMCKIKINNAEKAKEAAKILQKRSGARMIVIKMGKKGALLYSNEITEMYPSPEVEVVDTTAAGAANATNKLGYAGLVTFAIFAVGALGCCIGACCGIKESKRCYSCNSDIQM